MDVNMSYCQFENTNLAMQQCMHTLDQAIGGKEKLELSSGEAIALRDLAVNCHEFLETVLNMEIQGSEDNGKSDDLHHGFITQRVDEFMEMHL